jgi:iron-sulfur cluster assembly protein
MATASLVETTPLVSLSPIAAEKLIEVMQQNQLIDHALRVFVVSDGVSDPQYSLTFDSDTQPGDTEYDAHGLTVRIDPASAPLLQGWQIDYSDAQGFQITNPNACGCSCSCS